MEEEEKRFKIKELRDKISETNEETMKLTIGVILGAGVAAAMDYAGIKCISLGNPLLTVFQGVCATAVTYETLTTAIQVKDLIVQNVDNLKKIKELEGGKTR